MILQQKFCNFPLGNIPPELSGLKRNVVGFFSYPRIEGKIPEDQRNSSLFSEDSKSQRVGYSLMIAMIFFERSGNDSSDKGQVEMS